MISKTKILGVVMDELNGFSENISSNIFDKKNVNILKNLFLILQVLHNFYFSDICI